MTNRWFVVVGAILIQLCLGAIYAWSVFTPELEKYGWSKIDTQIVFAVGLAMFAISMIFAGRHLKIWGPQRLAITGGLVLAAGYILAGLLGGTDFWVVCIGIGFIGGIGIGLGYVVPIAVGMNWFPDHKGLITGLAVAGFGFGAMAWVKLAGSWGNLLSSVGLAQTFIIYGIAFGSLVLIGSIWMKMPPVGWRPKNYQQHSSSPESSNSEANYSERNDEDFTITEMLHTPQFYLIFITFAVSAGAGLMSIGLMKAYPMEALQSNGYSQIEASAIAGTAMAVFFSLANGIGRIVWGVLSDKLGRHHSVVLMAASQGVILFLFTSMAGNEYLLYLGATLIGFNFGGNFALFPALTSDQFGNKMVGQNYPYVFLSYGVGGIIFPIIGGLLGDMGNFQLAFSICAVACLVGAAASYIVFPAHKDEAHLPFSMHGFFHQLHLFDHEKEHKSTT